MPVSEETLAKYKLTIGIECHVQLATTTKLFSGADNDARGKEPNAVVSPIDYGLPGMLPVLNRHAVNLAIRAGKALNAEIARISRFDRKHYFYPDLPKGYQTTQMYHPIILEGYIDAPLDDGSSVHVRIHHAHMEEDAGKLTHFGDYSLVDLNRAGTPLIEIVSEPDIHSPAEAKAYASELHKLMTYTGVTHGDLYHGNMRFDVNVSVAPIGASELGKRAEVKNLNSFRSVEKAAEYEFRRQVGLLENGERVVQETRGWNDDTMVTTSQRSKEDAQDYRYMPDADIPPIVLSTEEIQQIQNEVATLPGEYRDTFTVLQLDSSVVNSLLAVQSYAEAVSNIQKQGNQHAIRVANWFASTIRPYNDDTTADAQHIAINTTGLLELSQMVQDNELSSTSAKEIFIEIVDKVGASARVIAESRDLLQVSNEDEIAKIVDEILADPASVQSLEDIRNGKDKAIGYLVGQTMKKSQGKANPALAQKLIRERL